MPNFEPGVGTGRGSDGCSVSIGTAGLVLGFEPGKSTDASQCIHSLVELQSRRSPDAVALTSVGRQITYRQLNARANRIARDLRSAGVKAGERVLITSERSAETIIVWLAILKAGGS